MPNDPMIFKVAHIGVNCENEEDAMEQAKIFADLFGLPTSVGKDSIYSGPFLELMKGSGRGKHGHIAIVTEDIYKARKTLEERGHAFDENSAKYDENDRMIVIYMEREIAGFAIHLLQQ